VTLVQYTRSSGHSVWSHSSNRSRTIAALPVVVVTRKRFSASRIETPSSTTIPSRPSMSPYRIDPAGSVLIRFVYIRSRNTPASGPTTSIFPSVEASKTPAALRTARHSRATAVAISSPSRGK
jgi:hypothetical protein